MLKKVEIRKSEGQIKNNFLVTSRFEYDIFLLCHLRKEEQKFVYYSNTWYFTSAKQLFII